MSNKFRIRRIKAKEILDSNSRPTIEVEAEFESGIARATVPSGLSTGKYEAAELRDVDGGVKKAIENIEQIIFPALKEKEFSNIQEVDDFLINLDGTDNKAKLGGNAILSVSIAFCRAIAKGSSLPLYSYIRQVAGIKEDCKLPLPSFNMVEGGKHAVSGNPFQEFMLVPKMDMFSDNLEIGKKIYESLGNVLVKKYGGNISKSAEGAYASPTPNASDVLDAIIDSAKENNALSNIGIAIDTAASEFYKENGYQIIDRLMSRQELADLYISLISQYPIISIEDPFFEADYDGWKEFMGKIDASGSVVTIFGDDLTVSNMDRMKMAKDACSGLILKPNQIGTVSEAIEAANLAKSFGWKVMVANRAGETRDDFIADLAVGIGAEFIKSGAPFPAERMAKYERLVIIEKEIIKFNG